MPDVRIANFLIGDSQPLAIIAGPCVIESYELCYTVAKTAKSICAALGLPYIFKASFDKANRTSGKSFRGFGMADGLAVLARIKAELDVPILTDVHESSQCAPVAAVADILQIPAFLSRQTDLLLSAAATGKAINIKKGQFLAPWDMKNTVEKVRDAGNDNVMLCERGASFGYNTLVVDMRSLPIMRSYGVPVIYDGTHSVQQPGGQGATSGGQREFIPHLVRAACATGAVDGLFIETHPDPASALSDAATMLPLDQLATLLEQASSIHTLCRKMT